MSDNCILDAKCNENEKNFLDNVHEVANCCIIIACEIVGFYYFIYDRN
jgi:hypothetical protein